MIAELDSYEQALQIEIEKDREAFKHITERLKSLLLEIEVTRKKLKTQHGINTLEDLQTLSGCIVEIYE